MVVSPRSVLSEALRWRRSQAGVCHDTELGASRAMIAVAARYERLAERAAMKRDIFGHRELGRDQPRKSPRWWRWRRSTRDEVPPQITHVREQL